MTNVCQTYLSSGVGFQNKPLSLSASAATHWVILHPTWLYSIRFVSPLSNKTPCKPIIYPSDTYSQFYDRSKTLLINAGVVPTAWLCVILQVTAAHMSHVADALESSANLNAEPFTSCKPFIKSMQKTVITNILGGFCLRDLLAVLNCWVVGAQRHVSWELIWATAEAREIVFEERERGFGDIRTNVGCTLSLSYSKP